HIDIQALDNGRADEVVYLDDDLLLLASDLHPGLGRPVRDELAVLRIAAELDHLDAVGRTAAHAPQLVPFLQPCVRRQLLAEADHDDVTVLLRPRLQLALHLLEIDGAQRMAERHDLHEPLAECTIEEAVRAAALYADVFAGQLDGLVVLDLEVVVVHAPDREAELGGPRVGAGFDVVDVQLLLSRRRLVGLRTHYGLESLRRGLDGALVDVAADPATAELLCDSCRGAAADEAVEDDVARVGRE